MFGVGGIADTIETAVAGLSAELLLIVPIGIGIAMVPFATRLGWRLLKSLAR